MTWWCFLISLTCRLSFYIWEPCGLNFFKPDNKLKDFSNSPHICFQETKKNPKGCINVEREREGGERESEREQWGKVKVRRETHSRKYHPAKVTLSHTHALSFDPNQSIGRSIDQITEPRFMC
ncbi:hypothetical protein L1887_18559 [Cichorium endivia]|nr:hypothetical protein L1887_18559 [Cichorium endivia]